MKKLLTYSAVLATAISVIGCGGGGSSSTVPANTTTTYKITNKSNYDLKTVSVIDSNSGVENQSGALDCVSQAVDCIYYYTGPEIKGPDTLVFKDGSGRTVAAYVSAFDATKYESARVNDWNTGLYLYKKLNESDAVIANMSQADIEARLRRFTTNYVSPDGKIDSYEEIGQYYAHVLATKNLTVNEFLALFAQRLKDFEVADASEFKQTTIAKAAYQSINVAISEIFSGKVSLIRQAYAQESGGGCPDGLMGFLGAIASGIQNAFPLAGTIPVAAVSLGEAICGSNAPDINQKLTDIESKLNGIENSLNLLHDKLAQFQDLYTNTELKNFIVNIDGLAKSGVTISSNYKSITSLYVVGNKANPYNSLLDYIKGQSGSLASEYKARPNGTAFTLMNKFLNNKTYISEINKQGITEYKNAIGLLNAKCKDFTAGDIVYKRVQCNLAINTSVSRLVASQQIALKIAKDVYDVAKAYPQDAKDLLGYNESVDSYEVLDKQFKTQIKEILEAYQLGIGNGGYFDAFAGMSAPLLASMKTVACYDEATQIPAISKWVKETNGNTEYLETNCRIGSLSGPAVKARYFRKIDGKTAGGDDVANVLGVLIEDNLARTRAIVSSDKATPYISLFDKRFVFNQSGDAPKPGYIAINNNDRYDRYDINSTDPIVVTILDQSSPTVGDYSLDKVANSADPTIWPQSYSVWSFQGGWVLSGRGPGRTTWMRITDDQGYSYVFVTESVDWDTKDNFRLRCASADCSAQKWSGGGGALKFKLGPQEVWLSQHGAYLGAGYPYGLSVDKDFYGWNVN